MVREMTRIVLLERQMARFLRKPVSVRSAAARHRQHDGGDRPRQRRC